MPHDFAEWTFPFEFDRVFFFSSSRGKVEEISGASANALGCRRGTGPILVMLS